MADKAFPIIPKDGKITIYDGAGSPLSYEVVYEDGDFNAPELAEGFEEVIEFEDRGTVYAARKAGRKSQDFSFSCHALRFKRDGSGNTHITDVVLKQGAWSAATSTAADYSDAHMVKLVFSAERSDFGESVDTSITLKHCHLRAGFAEGTPGKFSISGRVYQFASDSIAVA
jgi:hypothetical protein